MKKLCGVAVMSLLVVASGANAKGSRACGYPGGTTAQELLHRITANDAKELEATLVTNPDNLAAHQQLIEYYFEASVNSRTADLEEKREQHVFWLIEHHPESEFAGSPEAQIMPIGLSGSTEGYQHGKQLWLEQAEKHPNSQRVLTNAGQFLSLFDRKIGEELLQKAFTLDPSDLQSSSRLAQLYEQERMLATSSEEKASLAQRALSIRERGLENAKREERFYELGDLAVGALEAGETAKAEEYASELLQDAQKFKNDWNYGNAIHKGNIVLGRIALQHHDIASAKQHLLLAGETPGSPQLDSFGPNMTLAKELLEKGEREAVLTYLQSCAKFWKMGGNKLEGWMGTIKGGGTPDFSSNLSY
jgi:tetratricopeptide (TPR) repeat protein